MSTGGHYPPPPPYVGPPATRTPAPTGGPAKPNDPATTLHRWHYRRSLASRVTLLTTIAVGLSVAFLAAGVYVTARVQLQSQLDESLLDRARATARSDLIGGTPMSTFPFALGASDVRLALLSEQGLLQVMDGGSPLPLGGPELEVASGEVATSVRTVALSGEEYRVVAYPTKTPGQALIIAQPLAQQEKLLARLGGVSLVFGMLGVLGAGIAGWAVARNGLRPVRKLTASVEEIAMTEDLTPLPVEGDDENARLATAFNTMLTSVDASRDR
ncbi:MAG: HAMP domain-containing protein, partial [Cellulomonas sp.]|nr:HAMP domain-containing protein [Cellulomonas sp.]